MPDRRQHADKSIAFDDQGGVFVNVGAPANVCQERDRMPKSAGQDPCPLYETEDTKGKIWRIMYRGR